MERDEKSNEKIWNSEDIRNLVDFSDLDYRLGLVSFDA